MKSIQQLREERNVVAKRLRDLIEASQTAGKWTEQDESAHKADMAVLDSLNAEIERTEKTLQALNDSNLTEFADRHAHDGAKAGNKAKQLFAKWLKGGDKALTAEDWADIRATMSTTTGSQGGYTVQTDIAQTIADALKAYGGVRSVATILQTDMGNPMSFPTSDGTSETGELIAENTTATAADPSFGTISLNVYKFSSKIIAVPIELLADSAVDIESFVINRMATRIGRATNTYFTTGTGTSQPKGVVTAATEGVVGASTTAITVDDLIDLIHSVDPAYRASGMCRFMLHDDTLRDIRKLKDDTGRPIFIPGYDGLGGPMPDRILGYDVVINQDMATMAADAKSVLFGHFSRYYVRDVLQNTMFRFDDSAYAKLGQVGYLTWARSGGNLIDVGGCIKYFQNASS